MSASLRCSVARCHTAVGRTACRPASIISPGSSRIPLQLRPKTERRQARGASTLIRMSTLNVEGVAAAPQSTKPVSTDGDNIILKILAFLGIITQKNPMRIRTRLIPFLPVDLVVVSDPAQVEQHIRSTDLGRCYELPENKIPRWLRLFLESSRFVCKVDKSKFVHLITPAPEYEARLATIKSALASQPHSQSDVDQIVRLTKEAEETASEQKKNGKEDPAKNEALQKLMLFCANLVNSRFFDGKQIPSDVVKATITEMATPVEILNPFKAPEVEKAHEEAAKWLVKNKGNDKMKDCDFIHNICTAATALPQTLRTLNQTPDVPLEKTFTLAKNCPAGTTPRVALKETTLGGILQQPAIPGQTAFFFAAGAAAEQTGSLYYTFGSGVEFRSCPFLPFWKSLMTDVQASLLKQEKVK